jgi:hypothetical protein
MRMTSNSGPTTLTLSQLNHSNNYYRSDIIKHNILILTNFARLVNL